MAATKKLATKAISELYAELSVPIITASALRAMNQIEHPHRRRRLVFIDSLIEPNATGVVAGSLKQVRLRVVPNLTQNASATPSVKENSKTIFVRKVRARMVGSDTVDIEV